MHSIQYLIRTILVFNIYIYVYYSKYILSIMTYYLLNLNLFIKNILVKQKLKNIHASRRHINMITIFSVFEFKLEFQTMTIDGRFNSSNH